MLLTNRKKKGAVRIWVRLPGTAWDLTLPASGDEVALELVGRQQPGVSFDKDARRGQGPMMVLALHVLKGSLALKIGGREYALDAPPGPAYFHWDNISGPGGGPITRKSNPEGRTRGREKAAGRSADSLWDQIRRRRLRGGVPGPRLRSADKLPQAEADIRRRLAVYALGAVDDLQGLTDALAESPSAVTRQAAVRGAASAGSDGKRSRIANCTTSWYIARSMPRRMAETMLQLLHSPFDRDRPGDLCDTPSYLRHNRLAVRDRDWHLYRLAPAGRKIPYNAGTAEAERIKGYEAWKKLIPSGKLPPAEAPK